VKCALRIFSVFLRHLHQADITHLHREAVAPVHLVAEAAVGQDLPAVAVEAPDLEAGEEAGKKSL
jgi:hypothetical protein